MSIEEVERILDETQEAVEYQRVCVAGHRLIHSHRLALVWLATASRGNPEPHQAHLSIPLLLPQQIDELLAGSFTQEDEDAILEELNAITQVQVPRAVWSRGGWNPTGLSCLSPESWCPSFLPTVIFICTEAKLLPHPMLAQRDLCKGWFGG